MNLSRGVALNGVALNTVSLADGVLSGSTVDSVQMDPSVVDQNVEKLAKDDGLDVGGVWRRMRTIHLSGTAYGASRGAARDQLATLEAAMAPATGTLGQVLFAYHNGAYDVELQVVPQGLKSPYLKYESGGADAQPLAIPWWVTLLVPDPTAVNVYTDGFLYATSPRPNYPAWQNDLYLSAPAVMDPIYDISDNYETRSITRMLVGGEVLFYIRINGGSPIYATTSNWSWRYNHASAPLKWQFAFEDGGGGPMPPSFTPGAADAYATIDLGDYNVTGIHPTGIYP